MLEEPEVSPGSCARLLCLLAALVIAACGRDAGPTSGSIANVRTERPVPTETAPPGFVGGDVCAGCHAAEAALWRGSHHDLAMQPATASTVLGDFGDVELRYGDATTRFTERDNGFFVTTDGADGKSAEFAIRWTLGAEPLQQYLIEQADGRVQALSVAWDSRPAADGGQRWFHLYPDGSIDRGDPLHWTGTYQRWNTMCADCHSTNLVKGYDSAADGYATRFDRIDVDCEACHGPGSYHAANPAVAPPALNVTQRRWLFEPGRTIASRAPAGRESTEGEVCGQCHSRRSQLRDGHAAGRPLLDSYRPALLEPGLYHADGQIEGEVYELGSFLQSRMAAAGVTCSDCHEPHSAKLRAEGNAVCAQCHLPSEYDRVEHHRHQAGTAGAACVSCHMRTQTYMVIDARRDHSFRVPRPDLSAELATPNACNDCHSDQTNDWAAARVAEWYPDGRSNESHYGQALAAGRRWAADAHVRLLELLGDADAPEIVRATALSLLATRRAQSDTAVLAASLASGEPLLALAAIDATVGLPQERLVELLQPYLDDERLALRIAAARNLVPARAALSSQRRAELDAALEEFLAVQAFNADRPEGLLGAAALAVERGDAATGERLYRQAITQHPLYPALYVNLADLYRQTGRARESEIVLREGLAANPDAPAIELALGFALVRDGRRAEALPHFERAADPGAGDPYYGYVRAIAVNDSGDGERAFELLARAHERFPGHPSTLSALATLARDRGDVDAARRYAERLVELLPGDSGPLSLKRALE
jgi:predicted CXXCH cytochrome family protein